MSKLRTKEEFEVLKKEEYNGAYDNAYIHYITFLKELSKDDSKEEVLEEFLKQYDDEARSILEAEIFGGK